MVTTIQVSEDLRDELLDLKKQMNVSYEEVIKKAVLSYKETQEEQKLLLKESYEEMNKTSNTIHREYLPLEQEVTQNHLEDF